MTRLALFGPLVSAFFFFLIFLPLTISLGSIYVLKGLYGLRKLTRTKTGLNDTRHVVWAQMTTNGTSLPGQGVNNRRIGAQTYRLGPR